MTECVWWRASSQEASEGSEQIAVVVGRRHRFDLQLRSDSRAGESGLEPGPSVPTVGGRKNAALSRNTGP